jgi:hypothetical protein
MGTFHFSGTACRHSHSYLAKLYDGLVVGTGALAQLVPEDVVQTWVRDSDSETA